ncbi:hypothetical protein LWI29_032733 [Acer saccharum]|uniref:Uncharacterized protein n=1 Tax=Acer saccharum TaxID=4024 RepID=A0AA39W4J2_ACESA|nr:hypothetical protein LWI29_032733 [Acer saccharum]
MLQRGIEQAKTWWWRPDYNVIIIIGGFIEAGTWCIHSIQGCGRDIGEDISKGAEGNWNNSNCVAPGPIATEMFFDGKTEEMVKKVIEECPHGRFGETKGLAPVVGFLATDAGEWINGQVIRVNGGYV